MVSIRSTCLMLERHLVARSKMACNPTVADARLYVYDHLRILQQSAEPHRFDIG